MLAERSCEVLERLAVPIVLLESALLGIYEVLSALLLP
jgi:hypothetical protein